jgi:hypothetical protein
MSSRDTGCGVAWRRRVTIITSMSTASATPTPIATFGRRRAVADDHVGGVAGGVDRCDDDIADGLTTSDTLGNAEVSGRLGRERLRDTRNLLESRLRVRRRAGRG